MTASAQGLILLGLRAEVVTIEAHLGSGLVGTTIVGLADTAVRESGQRLRAALASCQVPALNRRLTINLVPASLPKVGTGFDLPIAVAALIVRGFLDPAVAVGTAFAAELGLDGSVRGLAEVPALVRAAAAAGFQRLVVAADGAAWPQCPGIEVIGVAHLRELIEAFGTGNPTASAQGGWGQLQRLEGTAPTSVDAADETTPPGSEPDLLQIRGQPEARECLLLAAAGGHHLLLHGDPGAGKTLLAERLVTILPDLDPARALEVTALHSLVGATGAYGARPPLQILGPAATRTALLGGGGRHVRPGALSLAHGGVLVINEAPDVGPRVIEALREPLETGEIMIRRASTALTFPARCQLVMTANPCPCGLGQDSPCRCTAMQRRRYQQRLSAPLLDRIDIHMQISRPHRAHLAADLPMSSKEARTRVFAARQRAVRRWAPWGYATNGEVSGSVLRKHGHFPDAVGSLLERSVGEGWLTMRGADSVLRLAWSIADLAERNQPTVEDLQDAIRWRRQDRWGEA